MNTANQSTLHPKMVRFNNSPLFEGDTLIEAMYQAVMYFVQTYKPDEKAATS